MGRRSLFLHLKNGLGGVVRLLSKVMGLVVFLGLSLGAVAETWTGRVVRVVDTLVLLLAGKREERVRLAGIDCPERGQAFGTKAKEALLDRVLGLTLIRNSPPLLIETVPPVER